MSETQTAAVAAEYNPFDPGNFAQGGGLWDGKTITITSAVAKAEPLKRKDGSPVIDEKTKEQVILTALFITGIADGADDKERHEEYSVGDKMKPTPDGEGFTMKDGGQAKFHANSNIAKLAAALKASGFDTATLFEGGKQKLGKLVGARFVFKAEAKVGKDGVSLKDKRGYDKNIHLPVKFVGYAAGVTRPAGVAVSAGADGSALGAKAASAVLSALAAAGGKLTRADLVRALAVALTGDADANSVIGLVVRDDFHKGQAWQYDGKVASL